MGLNNNRIERSEVREGDHIYTYRNGGTYSHHGIYVGDGKVVHYTAMRKEYSGFISANTHSERSCPKCVHTPISGVTLICLDCFLRDGSLNRYDYGITPSVLQAQRAGTCTIAPSDPPEIVIQRAKYLLQNGFGNYNLLRNNCEDFALYCKTELWIIDWDGVGRSGQVSAATDTPIQLATIGYQLLGAFDTLWMLVRMKGWATWPTWKTCFVVYTQTLAVFVYGAKMRDLFRSRYATDIGVRKDMLKVAVEDLPLNLGCGEMDAENTKKMRDLKEKITALKKMSRRFDSLSAFQFFLFLFSFLTFLFSVPGNMRLIIYTGFNAFYNPVVRLIATFSPPWCKSSHLPPCGFHFSPKPQGV